MWYLYLDESGDLGFDFVNKKPSKFFTVTILVLSSIQDNRKLIKAVKITLRRKLNPPQKRRRLVQELKGRSTTLDVKKYFYKKIRNIKFDLYTINLSKRRVYERLIKNKSRIYNFIARQVLDQIPLEKAATRIKLIIDRSKSKPEIAEFNEYIRRQLEARIDPKTPLDIDHWLSNEAPGLQASDMFCWGIFEKYERNKTEWYDMFAEDKIRFETQYL